MSFSPNKEKPSFSVDHTMDMPGSNTLHSPGAVFLLFFSQRMTGFMDHWLKRRYKSGKRKEWNFLFSFGLRPGELFRFPGAAAWSRGGGNGDAQGWGALFTPPSVYILLRRWGRGEGAWMRSLASPHLHAGTKPHPE